MTELTHRWRAFCRATRRGPDEFAERHVFIAWLRAQWDEWNALQGRRAGEPQSRADHQAFDEWLESRYG